MTGALDPALDEALVALAFSGDLDGGALAALAPLVALLEGSSATDVPALARGLGEALGARAAHVLCGDARDVADVAQRVARVAALLDEAAALPGPRGDTPHPGPGSD